MQVLRLSVLPIRCDDMIASKAEFMPLAFSILELNVATESTRVVWIAVRAHTGAQLRCAAPDPSGELSVQSVTSPNYTSLEDLHGDSQSGRTASRS